MPPFIAAGAIMIRFRVRRDYGLTATFHDGGLASAAAARLARDARSLTAELRRVSHAVMTSPLAMAEVFDSLLQYGLRVAGARLLHSAISTRRRHDWISGSSSAFV